MTDIVAPSPIAALPPAPQLTDTQADFNTKAFAMVGALPNFVAQSNAAGIATQTNAIAAQERATSAAASAASAAASSSAAAGFRNEAQSAAATALNAPGTKAFSGSAIYVSAGVKTLSSDPGKQWGVGQSVVIAYATAPAAIRMYGVILSYDIGTGAMTVDVPTGAYRGAGQTATGWFISLAGPREGVVDLGAGPNQLTNAISLGLHTSGNTIRVSVDGVDYGMILSDAQVSSLAPPGTCVMFAGSTPPPGWFKRNGAAVSRATYAALFAAIGTNYGAGDGSTTFNLPDDRGLVDRGLDEGRGLDPGRVLGSYQESQNRAHDHGGQTAAGGGRTPSGTVGGGGIHVHTGTALNAGGHTNTVPQVRNAGGSGTAASVKSEDTVGSPMNTNTVPDHQHTLSIAAGGFHADHAFAGNAVDPHAHGLASEGGSEARMRNSAKLPIIKY
ncbi:MAG: phage tail protein [Pseudorhodoferax sp.]